MRYFEIFFLSVQAFSNSVTKYPHFCLWHEREIGVNTVPLETVIHVIDNKELKRKKITDIK